MIKCLLILQYQKHIIHKIVQKEMQVSQQSNKRTLDLSQLKLEKQNTAKISQFLIMVEFLRNQQNHIDENLELLRQKYSEFGNKWKIIKDQLFNEISQKNNNQEQYQKNSQIVFSVLSHYNHQIRIPKDIDGLAKLQQKYHNKLLPPPSPCEYIDTSLWQSQDQKKNSENWMDHGYYWKTGDNKTKDNYNGDYNTIQPGFYRIKSARVLMADYQLLRKDFPQLQDKSKKEIQQWLLEQTAYLSEGQVKRILPGGDVHNQLELQQNEVEERVIQIGGKKKTGIRYRGAGRAVNFLIDDQYQILNGVFDCQSINVKGVGSQKIIQGFGPKQNGLLSLVDAIKQYSYQKLIQKISQRQNKRWKTVQTYAFIDIGLKYKKDLQSPATGYKGDRLGLTIRQASSRYESSFDEVCYYSVIPEQKQNIDIIKDFRQTLMKYGISSEQQPLQFLKVKQQVSVSDLSGSWNIQADATMSRFLDFSQFYIQPSSQLPTEWRMSEKGILEGTKADRFAFKLLLQNPQLMIKYFGSDDIQEAKKKYLIDLAELEKKYGSTVGKMRKPKFSWSWFLESDDSQVQNFATKYGLNYQQMALSTSFFEENYKKWLDF